jgi:ribonuclease P protein component
VTGRPSGGRSPKRRRLSRSAEFERVYRQGRSKSNRFLVLYAFPRADDAADDGGEGPRLGLSVSRRVGGAVDRTRVKRVLREAFWAEAERLPEGSDYVVVARPDARELAEREGMPGVRTALSELVGALTGADGTGRERTTAADRAGGATAADPGRGSGPASADLDHASGPASADLDHASELASAELDHASELAADPDRAPEPAAADPDHTAEPAAAAEAGEDEATT